MNAQPDLVTALWANWELLVLFTGAPLVGFLLAFGITLYQATR